MKKYEKNKVELIVKENYSVAECLRKLNLRPAGGNYKWFKKFTKIQNIDTSHFTGKGWSFGKKVSANNRKLPLSEILIENSSYSSSNHLKKRLIKEGFKKYQCEVCNNTTWNGSKIPLELEHCNGNNIDNRIENLKLLCPNCHAQTPFYRGKNKLSTLNERREVNRVKFGETLTDNADGNPEPSSLKREGRETKQREPKSYICSCGNKMAHRSLKCRECDKADRKNNIPPVLNLLEDFKTLKSFVQVGKKYGVSDNAVRKWLTYYKIDISMVKI
jgi:hypothetical protein